MMFTFEFIRIRASDKAHAMLERVLQAATDLDAAKVKAKSLFDTLDMPQSPMRSESSTTAAVNSSFGRQEITPSVKPMNGITRAKIRKVPEYLPEDLTPSKA